MVHSSTKVASVSTDVGMRVSVNAAYCLLGHRNEHSIQKTGKELRWFLMHGTMQSCQTWHKVQGGTENTQMESVTDKAAVPSRLYLDLSKVTVNSGTSENVTINQDNWDVMVCEASGK